MNAEPIFLDSITTVSGEARGQSVLSGSHGGLYAATLASLAGARAAVFNDAGIGFEKAGVTGVLELAKVGMASAAANFRSCRIGSATDAYERGQISVANDIAKALGIEAGMPVATAMRFLAKAPVPTGTLPQMSETRRFVTLEGSHLQFGLLDSVSLVGPQDEGQIIITGSHGGLVGGEPSTAIAAPVKIAAFNDAGIGMDEAGILRLRPLDERGIAAVTVDCMTARVGEALSTLETGVISRANQTARSLGALEGERLKGWLLRF